jgi:predicted Rossmann-fold nucleotide-binding protein
LCQRQLKIHNKPIALLNTRGFFDALLQQLQHMVQEGFLPASHIQSLIVEHDVAVLLDKVSPWPSHLRRSLHCTMC